MQIREHRGGLDEAMATVQTIDPTYEAVAAWANQFLNKYGVTATPEHLHVEQYGYDKRINWNTHIVALDGCGVLGFSDGPVTK